MRLIGRLAIPLLCAACLDLPGEAADCNDGEVVTRKAGKWECVAAASGGPIVAGDGLVATGDTLAVKFGTANAEALTKPLADEIYRPKGEVPLAELGREGCESGQFLKVADGAWTCAPAIDPALTPTTPTACPEGQVVRRGTTGWDCASLPPDHTSRIVALENAPPLAFDSLATLEGLLNLPAGVGLGTSMAATQNGVANGACIDLAHGWGTPAVGYAAWMTESSQAGAKWVPVQPGYEPGTTNLAAGRVANSSGAVITTASPAKAVDGVPTQGWETQGLHWLTIDLGTVRALSTLRIQSSYSGQTHATTTAEISFSIDGQAFTAGPTFGCTKPGDCDSPKSVPLVPTTFARYVRITPTALAAGSSHLGEVEVYSSQYTVSQAPDGNTLTFCNYTGETRSMALRVWR